MEQTSSMYVVTLTGQCADNEIVFASKYSLVLFKIRENGNKSLPKSASSIKKKQNQFTRNN